MATTSYGCSSPGRRAELASLLDTTFAASAVGVSAAVPGEFAALAEPPEFEPHEMHKQALPARTMLNRTSIRLIELLPAMDSDSPFAGWRKRFGDPQDPVTAISLQLAPGPWKTPEAGSAESQLWQTTTRQ